jgi:hypothetical protein
MKFIIIILLIILVITIATITMLTIRIPFHIGGSTQRVVQQAQEKELYDVIGIIKKEHGPKHINIVDVANVFGSWPNSIKFKSPETIMSGYLQYIRKNIPFRIQTQEEVTSFNPSGTSTSITPSTCYVIKNYKYLKDKEKETKSPRITDDIWQKAAHIVQSNPNIYITIAEDYKNYSAADWRNPKMHHIKSLDDYLCFYIAKMCKQNYIDSTIISDDRFYDFQTFGKIPYFDITTIVANNKGGVNLYNEKVRPRPNILGQINDYTLIRLNKKK